MGQLPHNTASALMLPANTRQKQLMPMNHVVAWVSLDLPGTGSVAGPSLAGDEAALLWGGSCGGRFQDFPATGQAALSQLHLQLQLHHLQ